MLSIVSQDLAQSLEHIRSPINVDNILQSLGRLVLSGQPLLNYLLLTLKLPGNSINTY